MKQSQTNFSRHFMPSIVVFVFSLLGSHIAFNQTVIHDSDILFMQFNYYLTANSSQSLNSATIYDDYENPEWLTGDTTAIYWNCQRQYLITAYTSPNDTVTLTFGTSSTAPSCVPSGSTCGGTTCCRDYYIYKGASGFPALIQTNLGVLDFTSVLLYSTSQDFYTIKVYNHGADTLHDPSLLTGYVLLIPKIKKLWIEAKPICSGSQPANTYYHFQVKTEPDISTIMNVPSVGQFAASFSPYGVACEEIAFPYNIIFSFYATDNYLATYDVINPPTTTPLFANNFYLNNSFGIENIDYYINYSQLNANLSTTSSDWGYSPIINLTYTDKVGYTGTNVLTVAAPIIIEASALPTTISTDTTATVLSGGIPGPPNANGIPSPSYDIYDYTVATHEIWYPYQNPISAMHGIGDVDSVIRIQHILHIPGGCELDLYAGMRLEFGPGAQIIIDPAPNLSVLGGSLWAYGYTTLTAYRGCEVSGPGTDPSTWGGIIVGGNPAWPQGTPIYNTHQGLAYFGGATISYADIAVQLGTSAANSGGQLGTFGAPTWYNNKEAIHIYPYSNTVTCINANGNFLYDNNASWFTPTDFVSATSVQHINVFGPTFTNNSSHPMSYAIYGLDAGYLINGATFTGSAATFPNYYSAIYSQSISGTHSIYVSGCNFSNSIIGVNDYAGTAPAIYNSLFNIPPYSGAGAAYYPGTDVLLLNDQNIGAIMDYTSGYIIAGNNFRTNAPVTTANPGGYYPYTTGTLEYNTGSNNNIINNNLFTGLGVAMNSNFKNNSTTTGLQYLCNSDTHIGYDIAALGSLVPSGGINHIQGTSLTGLPYNLPAGNIFSTHWNIWNQQLSLTYNYLSTSPAQYPAIITSGVSLMSYIDPATCYSIPDTGPYSVWAVTGGATGWANSGSGLAFMVATANVNHYMTDTNSINHRDSLYYWASQMGSAYGDLLTTNLLIEDSLTDSANSVYNNILSRYSLDSTETNDFVQGSLLEEILIYQRTHRLDLLTLTSDQVSTIQAVRANTSMWAHGRAEAWLNAYEGDTFTDSLLYPNGPDTTSGDGGDGGRMAYHHTQPVIINPDLKNQVYPNPTQDLLHVIYTPQTPEAIIIQIEDISGRLLISQPIQSGTNTIDMNALVPGMYLYRILEGNRVTMIGKIAKD